MNLSFRLSLLSLKFHATFLHSSSVSSLLPYTDDAFCSLAQGNGFSGLDSLDFLSLLRILLSQTSSRVTSHLCWLKFESHFMSRKPIIDWFLPEVPTLPPLLRYSRRRPHVLNPVDWRTIRRHVGAGSPTTERYCKPRLWKSSTSPLWRWLQRRHEERSFSCLETKSKSLGSAQKFWSQDEEVLICRV